VKKILSHEFEMKNFGKLKYFHGIQVVRLKQKFEMKNFGKLKYFHGIQVVRLKQKNY